MTVRPLVMAVETEFLNRDNKGIKNNNKDDRQYNIRMFNVTFNFKDAVSNRGVLIHR